ncbi:sensor histidine kinase [Rossellomorea marisflavi]|uniref:sensor histidine kinase n=1 Tax=Rossellomorea marisflavi TaxID=189381 RepID=UPI00345A611D
MYILVSTIQLISFFIIFTAVSRYSFSKGEYAGYSLAVVVIGQLFSYFVGVWGALSVFGLLIWISFRKEDRLTALGIFYAAYALVMNSFLGFLFADLIEWIIGFGFRGATANLDYLVYLLTAFSPPLLNAGILFLLGNYVAQVRREEVERFSGVMLIPVTTLLLLVVASAYVILTLVHGEGNRDPLLENVLYGLGALVLLGFGYFIFQYRHIQRKQLEKAREDQLAQLQDYTTQLEKLYDEIKGFRHDYVNILLTLESGIVAGDLNEVRSVFEQTVKPTGERMKGNEHSLVHLKNIHVPEIKSIMASKLLIAQRKGMNISLEILSPVRHIDIELISFTRIISILLDNAVEAAIQSPEREITVAVIEGEWEQVWIVENSIEGFVDVSTIFNKGASTKGRERGMGLYTVRGILEGIPLATLETRIIEPRFLQTLTIRKER